MLELYPEFEEFLIEINKKSRKPVNLLEFILSNETFYLSDRSVGIIDGLEHQYEPWVESWGTLQDNTSLQNIFDGDSLEIRSMTITILVSPLSRVFIKKLLQNGIENTVVKIYQWFVGMDIWHMQMVDTFICQNPITLSESSMLLSVDLVSPLMASNPYLWPAAAGIENQPIVIGKALGVPLNDLQTTKTTTIAQDFDSTATGVIFIENGLGFAATGTVSIDSEDVTYTAISASTITISARGVNGTSARPHYRGAMMVPYNGVYDYAICAGPVYSIDNLKADGVSYLNEVTFFVGANPVIARFSGRPPWLRIEPGAGGDPITPDPVTSNEYGYYYHERYGNFAVPPYNSDNINTASNYATLAISNHVGGGYGSYQKFSLYHFLNNISVNDWRYINGTVSSIGQVNLFSRCGSFGDVIDGVIGSIDGKYGYVDGAYGDLIATSFTVAFSTANQVVASHSKLRIIFVAASGSTSTLEEWDIDGLGYTNGTGYVPPWNSRSYTYSVSVGSFSDLALCKIRIELENVHSLTNAQYSEVATRTNINISSLKWNVSYFTPAGTVAQPYQELVSYFYRDLSSLGTLTNVTATVRAAFTISGAVCNLSIVKRSTSSHLDNVPLWSSSSRSSSIDVADYVFNLGAMTWGELSALRIGINQQVVGPETEGATRNLSTAFYYVRWAITYQPDQLSTPDEERVVYAASLTCDVTSLLGESPTPPKVVQYLIANNSQSGQYIDGENFGDADQYYQTLGYYMNGLLPAGTRLHEGLRTVISEGMCRLLFNQGLIRILSYGDTEDQTIDYQISLDDVLLKSRNIDNKTTSQIKNDITVLYDRNHIEDYYNGVIHLANNESIAIYQMVDYRKELTLINSQSVAQLFAERVLSLYSYPSTIFSFRMFMPAYQLEKGDMISISDFIDSRKTLVGRILTIDREFAQGKTGKINTFNIQVYNPRALANLDLSDNVQVDDNFVMDI